VEVTGSLLITAGTAVGHDEQPHGPLTRAQLAPESPAAVGGLAFAHPAQRPRHRAPVQQRPPHGQRNGQNLPGSRSPTTARPPGGVRGHAVFGAGGVGGVRAGGRRTAHHDDLLHALVEQHGDGRRHRLARPLDLPYGPAGDTGQQQRSAGDGGSGDDHASPLTMRAGGRTPRVTATMSSTCRVSGTLCARNTSAPCQAQSAVTASVPINRSPTGRPSDSPTKSLLDSDTSTGQPVSTISPTRRVTSSDCQVFLPKSWAGSMRMRSRGTPAATARSASATVRSITSAITSSYSTRCGRVRGCTPPVWAHTSPTPNSAATSASLGSTPPHASLSRSAPAWQTSRPTS